MSRCMKESKNLLCCKNTHLGRTCRDGNLHTCRQGWRAVVRRAEHGGRHAQPLPCDNQQGTACSWLQGYPFASDWYALVGVSCSRSCPSRRISRLYRTRPAPPTAPLELRGSVVFFLVRSVCTTSFSHPILVCRNRLMSRYSVCPSY